MKETNPYAFPHVYEDCITNGMTLRDYFAAKAMQGTIASLTELRATGSVLTKEHIGQLCEESYIVADAMLKAREQ